MKKVQFVLQGCLKMGGNGKISLFFAEMRGMFTLFPVLSRLHAGALPFEIPATRDMGRKGCPDRVRFLLLQSRLVLSRVSNKRGIRLQGIHCNQTLYMRIRKYVVLILFSAICTFSSGQISFGPELGTFMFASRGLNVVDSIFVDTYNGKDVGELMGGVFFEADMGIVHLTVSGLLMIILPLVQGRRLAPAGGRSMCLAPFGKIEANQYHV